MESQLLFLGTSGDSNLTAKRLRKSGGILIKFDNHQIYLDPGPGALQESAVQGFNPVDTTTIIATHNHIAHTSDINALISVASQQGNNSKISLIASQSIVDNITNPYNSWCHNIVPAISGKKICVDSIEVLPFQAVHNDKSAFGVKIFTPHFIIGYTGDTKYYKDICDQYKDVDILILNTKHSRNEKSSTNLTIEDAQKIITNTQPTLAILTHFGEKAHSENPLYEARDIQRATNIQTIAATDGLCIAPENYSAKLKTKTLNLYN